MSPIHCTEVAQDLSDGRLPPCTTVPDTVLVLDTFCYLHSMKKLGHSQVLPQSHLVTDVLLQTLETIADSISKLQCS